MDKKRNISYLVCAMLASLALTACNKNDESVSQADVPPSAMSEQTPAPSSDMAAAPSTDAGASTQSNMGQLVDDASITASVRTEIVKDPDLSNLQISVDTKGGVVTLEGKTTSEAARTKAVQIARAVTGVTDVNNRLIVEPQS